MTVDRWARYFWLSALVWMVGCSQASNGQGLYDSDASVEELAASSEALGIADDEESAHAVMPTSGDMTLASTLLCGRAGYVSGSCPNVNASVAGFPQTPRSGTYYGTTGWQGGGQVGPGLANRWVVVTMSSTGGDPDIYVKKNGTVSTASYDCRPWTASNPEYCAFYLDSATDYLSWGVDVYSGTPSVTVTIDARACASGTVYTGVPSFQSSSTGTVYPPPAMTCCACSDGYAETDGQCCRTITQCTQPSDCASGFCVDGYCCDKACAGGCERCDRPQTEGLCRTVAYGNMGSPSCSPYVCNGANGSCPISCSSDMHCASGHYCNGTTCVPKLINGSACTSANQCQANYCSEGLCCDQACGNYRCIGWTGTCPTTCTSDASCLVTAYCNASNACVPKQPNGSACIADNQCSSASCVDGVCCNTACAGSCDRCDQSGFVGTCRIVNFGSAGQPSCSPYVCGGQSANCPTSCANDASCALGYICKAGVCEPKAQNGTSCSSGNDCHSGICTDGVCCDQICDSGCERCDLAGSKGICGLVTAGTPSSSCGLYLCNGKGPSCPASCTSDAQCTSNAYCYAGTCQPKSSQGMACNDDQACASGFCVDGACCESACEGQCERCDAPGTIGSCTAVSGKPVGMREACANDGSGCGGACDGVNRASCTYPSGAVVCAAASCVGGVEKLAATCSGDGRCAQEERPCAPYACGAMACLSSCESQADCSASGECVSGQCVGALDTGNACVVGAECRSGHCVDGVCCGSACEDACSACNIAGSLGICSPSAEADCAGEEDAERVADDESGCGCRLAGAGQRDTGRALISTLALGLLVLRRRRRGFQP